MRRDEHAMRGAGENPGKNPGKRSGHASAMGIANGARGDATTRSSSVSAGDSARSAPTLHVFACEESGGCTLERIAREAGPGDEVLAFGPRSESAFLRDRRLPQPLSAGIDMRVIAPVGGGWATVLPEGLESLAGIASSGADGSQGVARLGGFVERALATWRAARHGTVDDSRRPRFYGPRARALFARLAPAESRAQPDGRDAGVPDALPSAPAWSEGRRARVRRELGLSPREVAILLAGDPSDWIDGSFVARAVGMAFVSGAPLRLVVSPRMPRAAEIARFLVAATGAPAPIVDARADTPWEILPALDAGIVDRDGRATQPVACRGARSSEIDAPGAQDGVSALPALWALACAMPVFVHAQVEMGRHAAAVREEAASPSSEPARTMRGVPGQGLLRRFGDEVAPLAHALATLAREVQATRAISASAASR